jgi:response regulator RpfG family c-di-GMP phosphodiesterase
MNYQIMFVDDEKNVLKSLQRSFIDEEAYELLLAESGEEALQMLQWHSPVVIVADMRMPGMDGVEFLTRAQQQYPDAVCMILSGYADIESIMQAINEGHVWRYITKPWDDNDLKLSVKNAIEYYEKRMEAQRLLKEVEKKNAQLKGANEMLEQRVRERTIQLQERNELLQMVVDNTPLERFMQKACNTVSRQLDGRNVFVIADFLGESYGDGKMGTTLHDIAARTSKTGENIFEEHGIGLVLSKAGTVLGSLVIENDGTVSPSQIVEAIDSVCSIVSIALSQQKAIQDIPGFLDDLNDINTVT